MLAAGANVGARRGTRTAGRSASDRGPGRARRDLLAPDGHGLERLFEPGGGTGDVAGVEPGQRHVADRLDASRRARRPFQDRRRRRALRRPAARCRPRDRPGRAPRGCHPPRRPAARRARGDGARGPGVRSSVRGAAQPLARRVIVRDQADDRLVEAGRELGRPHELEQRRRTLGGGAVAGVGLDRPRCSSRARCAADRRRRAE